MTSTNKDTVLVVLQLSGGNDFLNSIVPYSNPLYFDNRPNVRIPEDQVLPINDHLGFNPNMAPLKTLYDEGKVAIIQGVGYPNPNRSHFRSMDIWHTCRRKTAVRNDGWLGRFLDESQKGKALDLPALHLGREKQPLALVSRNIRVPSVTSLDRFRLKGNSSGLRKVIAEIGSASKAPGDDLLGFVQSSTGSALSASEKIEAASGSYKTGISYPETGLAKKLKTVAQLIDSGLKTRIYYVTLDGFDTHSRQGQAHAALLREVSTALDQLAHIERV